MKHALLVVVVAACGSGSGTPDAPDAPPDVPIDGLPGAVIHGTIRVHGGGPIAGARVCLYQHAHCVTAEPDGTYTLDGVPATDFGVVVDVPGYVRTLVLYPPAAPAAVDIALLTDAAAQARVTGAGGTWPLLDSAIIAPGADMAGVTYTMTPSSGVTDGATFFNVTAGTVVVAYTLAGKSCVTAQDGWHGATAGTVRMPAEAATLTSIVAHCE